MRVSLEVLIGAGVRCVTEEVFRVPTDPALVVQWLGPRGHLMTIDHHDCRTGDSYRHIHSSDGNEFAFHRSTRCERTS